jgi:hypothetical protein
MTTFISGREMTTFISPCAHHHTPSAPVLCPTCIAAHAKACKAERLWLTKAKGLNLPLSYGKEHSVAQGGPFTGVFVDTFLEQYRMLHEKLEGIQQNFDSMCTSLPPPHAR